jgi:putative SOS response-associated peptidase YedK
MSVPILRRTEDGDTLELTTARWSFVPFWWKEAKPPTLTFNARNEDAAKKPMWRYAYAHGRAHCLVPAEAWYEWQLRERIDPDARHVISYKQPYLVRRPDGRPFAFAGLLSLWKPPDRDEAQLTCSIITQPAATSITAVHERMPTVLPDRLTDAWLDLDLKEAKATAEILAEPETDFIFFPVSTRVNSARYDGPELIVPELV